ncbi:MAG: hypothetical protein ACI9SP_002892 [Arenicella sp.]|jgi:hypothetical protein
MNTLGKYLAAFCITATLFTRFDAFAQNNESELDFATAAHHGILNSKGMPMSPKLDEIDAWIEIRYRELSERADKRTLRNVATLHKELSKFKELDKPIVDSILLDLLMSSVKEHRPIQMIAVNRVLRELWFKQTLRPQISDNFDWQTSLPADIAKDSAVTQALSLAPDSMSTAEYIESCLKLGVPAPEEWQRGGSEWKFEGPLLRNFLNLGQFTEVWTFEDDNPDGICVALPRYNQDPESIASAGSSAVGIICLGRETGNACYYDTGEVEANQSLELNKFVNGSNVSNGVCSDCHAGENPFITHSIGPLDLGSKTRSPKWHVPFIRDDYPQNPGPLTLLDQVTLSAGQSSCLDCHNPGIAGRFPDILALNLHSLQRGAGPISDYCRAILTSATDGYADLFTGEQVAPTMARLADPNDPTNLRKGSQDPDYSTHRSALAALCQSGAITPPEVVPFDPKDDRTVISPPVIGPLYACSNAVEVRGGIYNASVSLMINGIEVANQIVKQPNGFSVKVPALEEGDQVIATHSFSGVTATTDVVIVKSHLDDYPNGLPAPEIDPTVAHQCGRVIAVRHVPGVDLSVFSNGANERKFSLGGDWSNLRPDKSPFDQGDKFDARQSLCDDVSAMSNTVTAGAEPSPLPIPRLKDGKAIAGQPLLHIENLAEGALTDVGENSAGQLTSFSTAVTRAPEVDVASGLGRNIIAGDKFLIVSTLCEGTKVETDPVEPCDVLPAPRIAQPLVGDITVTVTQYVAGAQIQIYDANGNEIADGSGNDVGLTRPIESGDVLTVVQRLGECVSREAYRISAICLDPELCK